MEEDRERRELVVEGGDLMQVDGVLVVHIGDDVEPIGGHVAAVGQHGHGPYLAQPAAFSQTFAQAAAIG